MIDIHCHILPGLDDGAADMESAIEMLRIAGQEGIKSIIATPHYKEGRGCADLVQIKESLKQLQQKADQAGISVKLYPGNEIYYCSSLDQKLEQNRICSMNDTEFLLTEFSPFEGHVYIRNAMEDIMGLGYTPILAHAERYQCMTENAEHIRELKEMGCYIQVNASSVTGDYGWKTKRFVQGLLKKRLVDFIGTDAHGTAKRKPEMEKCAKLLYRKYDRNYADALLFQNAENLLINDK